ncbi:hypothetical protein CS053_00890 [Rhodanobacter glycinis]|uniref:Uncharacterized protein n=1 Tax=Rhodanobacter glycinis TaxID=582702 RepID=A0A5B9DYI1_9GAMM|nr:hypothetical protein CS053_00890 [Rhodanobacter glycinis]
MSSSPCLQGEVGRGNALAFKPKAPLPNPPLRAGEGVFSLAIETRGQSSPSSARGSLIRLFDQAR